MGLEDKRIVLPQIRLSNKLHVVLSNSEVRQLLKAPKYLKHRLMLGMLYGCGLRSYELCNLRLEDVDFERKSVLIRQKKARYDRYVPLSIHLIKGLKKYIFTKHPQEWLFNSQTSQDGKPRGITTSSIQWVIKENRSKVSTSKLITAHVLRHTYATHLLEQGLNIVSLKELLGHALTETTLIYLHVANTGTSAKFSPLDSLYSHE